MIGEDPHFEKRGRIFNRVIEWNRDGITVEADQRHARDIVRPRVEMRLSASWKG